MKRLLGSRSLSAGVGAAVLAALAAGLLPIFAKQAYAAGSAPITVAMLRTVFAAGLLWILYLSRDRHYLTIYPFALVSCLIAGAVNGIGSLLFYVGLSRVDASLAQLLFTLHVIFLTGLSWLDGHRFSTLTWARIGLGIVAVGLLKWSGAEDLDWVSAGMLVTAGGLYALHVFINQRTLYDVPAPTVTLYTLTGMSVAVVVGYGLVGFPAIPITFDGWMPIVWLTLFTIVQRLTLFMGVKQLGGTQTILVNLGEALVTILAAALFLGETLSPGQWAGALVLAVSIGLIVREGRLGALPQPRPWVQIFTTLYHTLTGGAERSGARPHAMAVLEQDPHTPIDVPADLADAHPTTVNGSTDSSTSIIAQSPAEINDR